MKTAVVDYRISEEEKLALHKLGYHALLCPKCPDLYAAISGHPDIQMTIIDTSTIILQKNINKNFINELNKLNKSVHLSFYDLKIKYPHDIILNSLILGDIFIHKLNSSDLHLLNLVKDKRLINANQGYTKCSTAIVNEKAIITSDKSIMEVLKNEGIDMLYVPPGDIDLPGLDYGFIGGTCGLLDKHRLAFFGDLNYYKYGNEIISFLEKHKVTPIYLKKGRLIDRGTLFVI